VSVGKACAEHQDRAIRNITAKRVQIDEIWSFVGCKQKNVTEKKLEAGIYGDVWTSTAIDADTKLVISWSVGRRDAGSATDFLQDVAGRLSNRVQLTTDGHKMYLDTVYDAFAGEIDYAQLIKVYGSDPEAEQRHSPARCLAIDKIIVLGDPDSKHISTGYVERQDLNMRMNMRRFTRLTNAFSKKLENHVAILALFHMHYNFARMHETLRVTPAMKAGISSHVWSIREIVLLIESRTMLAA
jgi:IS1 family transposase